MGNETANWIGEDFKHSFSFRLDILFPHFPFPCVRQGDRDRKTGSSSFP